MRGLTGNCVGNWVRIRVHRWVNEYLTSIILLNVSELVNTSTHS